MNPLLPSARLPVQRRAALSNDVEMLQTDVMRFFAIMCLCLTAIFALVKALPLAPPADRTMDREAQSASLAKQIAALKDKLAEAQSKLNSEINMRQSRLAEIGNDIQDRRRVRAELNAQIENESRKLKNLHAAVDRAREKPGQELPRQPESHNNPSKPQPAPQPVGKGFTLRFASNAALETLIMHGEVNFYALAAAKAWQLKLRGGSPAFIAVKLPRTIYEMESATVPGDYVRVFQRQVAAFERHTLTWGVTLPHQMSASITRLIKDREGGDLVIMPDGEVILN